MVTLPRKQYHLHFSETERDNVERVLDHLDLIVEVRITSHDTNNEGFYDYFLGVTNEELLHLKLSCNLIKCYDIEEVQKYFI